MPSPTPTIYAPDLPAPRLEPMLRIVAAGVAVACAVALRLAMVIQPSPDGMGSHEQLHLPECQFLTRTGLPCPSCGMTTSFAWFVRGHLAASAYVQPMGFVLAIGVVAGVWIGLYIALTGRSMAPLTARLPMKTAVAALLALAGLAWMWKIHLHVAGLDGWR